MNRDNKKHEIIQPVTFLKEGEKFQQNPVYFMEKEVNGITRFAIVKTTEGGKYLRGNMLFYSLNGVSVYTEDTNVIFVNTENNTLFIRDYERVTNEISPVDPEHKQYIVLYTDLSYDSEGIEYPFRWEAVTGRTSVYDNIRANIEVIDIDKSLVLVETVAFKDCLTVREFMNYIKNGNLVEDDEDFDVNDYAGTDYI